MHFAVKIAALLVFAAAGLRLAAIMDQPTIPHSLDAVHDQVTSVMALSHSPRYEMESLHSQGVDQIVIEQFDSQSLVVMRPGRDRQPGVAGIDDNANGIIDDAAEMGATRSDDLCGVQPSRQANPAEAASGLILQRGAFVPLTPDSQHGASPGRAGQPRRAIVKGHFGEDRWSFLLPLP